MEKINDFPQAKRFKTAYEQNLCSTFQCLSDELILNLFTYFNTKEILQSFSNLNSRITSCVLDRQQKLHVHLDHQMSYLPDNYSPDQVISLRTEHVFTPIDRFINLKSLFIVYRNSQEDECLNMINEISKLPRLINFKLLLVGSEQITIDNEVIKTTLSHPSVQRIILSKNNRNPYFYANRRNASLKLAFSAVQLVYASFNSSDSIMDQVRNRSNHEMSLSLPPQYHVRHLDLDFKNWTLTSLVQFLSALPSLVTLKIRGACCCTRIIGWFDIDAWDEMLRKLNGLERVDIEIRLAIPMECRKKSAKKFNKLSAQRIETCKRINLTAGPTNKESNSGCVQISASLGY